MAIKFVFLILPEIHIMDLAGPDQALLEAIGYDADFEIQYCSSCGFLLETAKSNQEANKLYEATQLSLDEAHNYYSFDV